MADYKYFIGTVEVFPLDNKLSKVIYEKPIPSSVYLEKKLSGSLIFDSKGSFDFKAQEAADPTEELQFNIKRKCNGVYLDFIKLLFTVGEGEFDDDLCQFKVNTKSKTDFRKDIKVNIIIKQNLINVGSGTQGLVAYASGYSYPAIAFTQGFYFDKTILSVAQQSNPNIKGLISDFFQINPENVSTECLPGITNVWKNLVFSALSDVQYPVPSDKARFEFITFQELMDDLNTLFDVFWFIDVNDNLRIEHRFYFDGILGLNLLDQKYRSYLKGTKKYNYDLADFPRTETMRVINSRQYFTFTNGYFATINSNNNEVVRETKKINTDLSSIIYYGGSSSNDGVFLFAGSHSLGLFTITSFYQDTSNTETGYYYFNEKIFFQNALLTPMFLSKLHLYGRYDTASFFESSLSQYYDIAGYAADYWARGQIRAGAIKHKTVRPIVLQKKITVPLCCDEDFDPSKKVKTELGTGDVISASFDMNTDILELEVKYPAQPHKFKPTDVSGLDLWLKANEGITTSGAGPIFDVNQWNDLSGNGRHAVSSAGTRPTKTSDGRISFLKTPGSTQRLTVPAFQLFPNKRGTIFVMYDLSVDTTIRDASLISTVNGAMGIDFDISVYRLALYSYTQTSLATFYYPQNLYTNRRLFQMKRYEDDKIICRDNSRDVPSAQVVTGTPDQDLFNPAIVDNVLPTVKPIIIGHNPYFGSGTTSRINIAEVLIYNRALTNVEAEKIELYIAKQGFYKIGSTTLENT